MNFIIKNKTAIHAVMIFSELLDVLIAILINLLTQENFDLLAPRFLVPCCMLVLFVIAHIICSVIQHNASQQTRKRKLQKAFQEHGGYDALAEEMISCVRNRDVRSFKSVKKMADWVER